MHELKISPKYYSDVILGRKTFEIRKDDRGFELGDKLTLRECDNEKYSGRMCVRIISYILRDAEQYGLKKGFVILGINKYK